MDQNEKIDFEVFSTVYYEKIAPHIQNQTTAQTTTESPTVPTLPSETDEETSTNEPSEHTIDDNDNDNDNDKYNHEYQEEQVNNKKNSFWNLYGLIPKLNIFSQKTTDTDDHTDPKPTTDNSKYDAETQQLIEGKSYFFFSPFIHNDNLSKNKNFSFFFC